MSRYYHVCRHKWDGGALEPLARRVGEAEAIEQFVERWGDTDAALAQYHVHGVFVYRSLSEAQDHQEYFGGHIVSILADAVEWRTDPIEGHTYTIESISPEHITPV